MPNADLPLIERLKKARIVQVLAVYLGASWVILQIADVLQGTAGLPDWVGAFTLLLLLIGLVIILATAWVQSLQSTTEKEEAGELPTDWEIAPADVLASLKSGKLPHLTWGRAIMGGVMALSMLFGGAGVYVVVTGGSGILGPTEAGADMAAAGIAVLPFDVVGQDLDVWREGMVDVLATNLDGMGGYRAIDSRTVLARWREHVTGDVSPDLRTSLEAAGATGARYGLMGSMVGTPAGVRINAELYDLSNGEEIVQVFSEGPADSVLALVGALSVDLTRDLLAETGQDLIASPRTASLTTASLPALRAYLEGEAVFRQSDFEGAVAAYERAVEMDSTFALAWFRLADAYGWLDNQGNAQAIAANARAAELADQLPVRDQLLLRAANALTERDLSYLQPLLDAARNYPDDPEIWFSLGEFYIHGGKAAGLGTWADINEAFSRAVALDPSFSPYQVHWVEGAIISGDTATATEALQTYRENTVDDERTAHLELMFDLFLTDEVRREEALARLADADDRALQNAGQWGKAVFPDQAWVERVARRGYEISGHNWWYFTVADAMLSRGRFADLREWLADPSSPGGHRFNYTILAQRLGQPFPEWFLDQVGTSFDCGGDHPQAGCGAFMGWIGIELGWANLPEFIEANRHLADSLAGIPDEEGHAADHAHVVDHLEGHAALQAGDSAEALGHLRRLLPGQLRGRPNLPLRTGAVARSLRLTVAELLAPRRPREALELLDRMDGALHAFARVRAGQIYEAQGDEAAASKAYQAAWSRLQYADEGNEWAALARDGVDRLGG